MPIFDRKTKTLYINEERTPVTKETLPCMPYCYKHDKGFGHIYHYFKLGDTTQPIDEIIGRIS